MGHEVELWEGLFTAIADGLYEMAGNLVVRTTAPYDAGDASITVEATHRFPATGRIAFGRQVAEYTGLTDTSFTGLTDFYTGDAGVQVDLAPYSVVQDVSRKSTQMDDLRAAFLLPTAEGTELDTLGRNYGIARPLGIDDDTYRALLEVWIWLPAQTMYACEQILDVLYGSGNYDLYEDLETYPHTVFVLLGGASVLSTGGKTFLAGGEAQTRTSATTVTVDMPPTFCWGIWDAADPYRRGTNYANKIVTCSTAAGTPDRLFDAANGFLVGDLGKPVILDGSSFWTIAQIVGVGEVRLVGRSEDDGSVTTGAPDRLVTDIGWFEPWMAGHKIAITSSVGSNAGTYVIAEVVSLTEVRLTGATFATEADVDWQLIPNLGTDASVAVQLPRTSIVGSVITAPATIPVDVLVDYVTIYSAELVEHQGINGDDQFPFYLGSGTSLAAAILDLITAAGVQVVLVEE